MTSATTPLADRTEPSVPLPLAAVIIVGAIILVLIVVGGVVWLSAPRLSTGPAVAPPPRSSLASTVEYDSSAGTASAREMRVQLPRPPYECNSAAAAAPPLFTSNQTCNALVHANYNSKGDDWYASFGLAVVSPSLVVSDDLEATGDRVYAQLLDTFFPGEKTTVEKRTAGPESIAAPGKALAISSEVHYSVPGLASSYDRVLLVLVELANGEHAVCYSVRPSDTSAATLQVLNASLNTLVAK